jgi:hypothetical protein
VVASSWTIVIADRIAKITLMVDEVIAARLDANGAGARLPASGARIAPRGIRPRALFILWP